MAPGLKCFLDVDDLTGIGELEVLVQQSAAVLCFLTDSYFRSRNCRREVQAAIDHGRPLILVRETMPFHGGLPLQQIIDSCPEDLRAAVFVEGRPVIQWHRQHDFKLVSLRLIIQQLMVHGLAEEAPRATRRTRRPPNLTLHQHPAHGVGSTSSAAVEPPCLHINGEISNRRITLAPPRSPWSAHVLFSKWNPGVEDVIQQLGAHVPGLVAAEGTAVTESAHIPATAMGHAGAQGASSSSSHTNSTSACFLLYLNEDKWTSPCTEQLADQVRAALACQQKIIMVTEKDEMRGAMRIRDMRKQTPQDICNQELYDSLAVLWFDGPHRQVCLKQLALEVELANSSDRSSTKWQCWMDGWQHLSFRHATSKPRRHIQLSRGLAMSWASRRRGTASWREEAMPRWREEAMPRGEGVKSWRVSHKSALNRNMPAAIGMQEVRDPSQKI